MARRKRQVFLSFSGSEACEASLLQYAIESQLAPYSVKAWSYQRDQAPDTRAIGVSLKTEVQRSFALIFLASPSTINGGAAQWMELAYADAFEVPTFVLLHRITYAKLRLKERGAAPFLTEGQCTPSVHWQTVVTSLARRLASRRTPK